VNRRVRHRLDDLEIVSELIMNANNVRHRLDDLENPLPL